MMLKRQTCIAPGRADKKPGFNLPLSPQMEGFWQTKIASQCLPGRLCLHLEVQPPQVQAHSALCDCALRFSNVASQEGLLHDSRCKSLL